MTIPTSYMAYVVTEKSKNHFSGALVDRSTAELPRGSVTIKVRYSSLNYKDALSASGAPGITKQYPHVPGIDAAGIVVSCDSDAFLVNDTVLVTGYDLGSNWDGGYAEYIRVPTEWVVPAPPHFSMRDSMILGTAGFTAARCILALKLNGSTPELGEILVTGSTGGVGSIAVALLASEGYRVVASTGKNSSHEYLKELGATRVIDRCELEKQSKFPLLPSVYSGAVDTVGGMTLENVIKKIKLEGSVASCGHVGGSQINTTVYPFILRGINLLGIDSAWCPMETRKEVWHFLAEQWHAITSRIKVTEIKLDVLEQHLKELLKGNVCGRIIIAIP